MNPGEALTIGMICSWSTDFEVSAVAGSIVTVTSAACMVSSPRVCRGTSFLPVGHPSYPNGRRRGVALDHPGARLSDRVTPHGSSDVRVDGRRDHPSRL